MSAVAAEQRDREPERRLRLSAWRPIGKGNLLGVCDIELAIGLTLFGVIILAGRDGAPRWAKLPVRPVLDASGAHLRLAGAPQYAAIGRWSTDAQSVEFATAALAELRRLHPGAFEKRAKVRR